MGFLRYWAKVKSTERPLEDMRHKKDRLLAAEAKPFQAFRARIKRAFKGKKKRSPSHEQPLDMQSSKEPRSDKSGVAALVDKSAPVNATLSRHTGVSEVVDHKEVSEASGQTPSPIIESEDSSTSSPSEFQCRSAEHSTSTDTRHDNTSSRVLTLRRVRSCSNLASANKNGLSPKNPAWHLDFEALKQRLVSEAPQNTEPFSNILLESPDTPSNTSFGLNSRADSGVSLSYAAEAQRWKRAYCVQQNTHRREVGSLTKNHEKELQELKNTYEAEIKKREEQPLLTVLSLYQNLNLKHQELVAQQQESSTASSESKSAPVNQSSEILIKARPEQRDRELVEAYQTNGALQTELINTRYAKDVMATELAEVRTAWEREVAKNARPNVKNNGVTDDEVAKVKSLYEKEQMKNMQLTWAMQNDPIKTAEMHRTIEHLRNELVESQNANNKHLVAFKELEKTSKSEQDAAKAELKAAAAQNEMLSDAAHEFCKRKATFQQATNQLVDALHTSQDQGDLAKAVKRYCGTVTHEKELESLIERYAERLTQYFAEIGWLEKKAKEQEIIIADQKLDLEILELQSKGHANKVTKLEIDANQSAGDLARITAEKDAQIQQLQSQMKQIQSRLIDGVDACMKWFLDSKDQEIESCHVTLASANQRIEQLQSDLYTKQTFQQLDNDHRQLHINNLELYPDLLAAAQKELESIKTKLSEYESRPTSQDWVDMKTHLLRVAEIETQTRAQIGEEVHAEVHAQIKTETEQKMSRNWIVPLQQLGGFLWNRICRLEQPFVAGGLDIWDQERWALGQQSQRLRVSMVGMRPDEGGHQGQVPLHGGVHYRGQQPQDGMGNEQQRWIEKNGVKM